MSSLRPQSVLLRLGAAFTTALVPAAALAQMHHVDAPERVTRAIGVYEWTGDLSKPTAARFVPVSLFINGHFEDAGLYLAQPVPFALQPGDVYALEHAGEPEGLLDLEMAKRVVTGRALADDDPEGAWYAFGKFKLETPPPAPRLHPAGHLTAIQSSAGPNTPASAKLPSADDNEPHMSRRNDTGSGSASSGSGSAGSGSNSGSPAGTQPQTPSTTSSTGTSSPTTASTGSSDDDTDRPTLRRRDPSQDPERRRAYGSGSKTASVTAAGPALGEDPDRPILGRVTEADTGPAELSGTPADMHQAVAVSDATHDDHHPFARAWDSSAEEADTLAAMAALAKPRLAAYLAANGLVSSSQPVNLGSTGQATSPAPSAAPAATSAGDTGAPPKLERGIPKSYQTPTPATPETNASASAPAVASQPAAKATAAHRSAYTSKTVPTPAAPLTLAGQQVAGFTLSYGGLPTFVYTAAAATSLAKPGDAPPAAQHPVAYITLVAQRLPSGQLQLNLSTVTDSAHLDRTPRLRLIDAVDPDDSHRASLLFEVRAASSRQFALYRLTSVQAEQTFTTASIE